MNGSLPDEPKCLLRLGGITLLERQVAALRGAGIDEIFVVVGFQADRVRRVVPASLHYVENARFAQTNSLYSLWLARPLLLGGFIVLNCDVLFHPQLLTDLLTARHEAAALVAYRDDGGTLGEEEMKVQVRRGRVIAFSKEMAPEQADGENVGILKFGAAAAADVVRHLDELVSTGHARDWAPRAFHQYARRRPLHAVATRGYPWIEIDFPEDYDRARTEVLPAIERIPVGFGTDVPFDPSVLPARHRRGGVPQEWPEAPAPSLLATEEVAVTKS